MVKPKLADNNGRYENIEADLEFAKRTEEAWQRYEKGEFIGPLSVEEFKRRMKSW